jgi:hypothetical protein
VNSNLSAFFAMNTACAARCAEIEREGAPHPWERVNAIEDTQVGPLGYRIAWRDRYGVRHVEQYRRPNV